MKPPAAYAEWVLAFDALKRGGQDEETARAMESGTLSWTSGVAERFSTSLFGALDERLKQAAARFQRQMSLCRGSETEIVQSILSLRREIAFLLRLANLPAIPEEKRAFFRQPITQFSASVQRSLEESARSDRTGRLGYIVRNNRVDGATASC